MTTTAEQRGARLNTGRYKYVACHQCGVEYGLPEKLWEVRQIDQQTFYCPLGHGAYYPAGKTATQIQQERAERAERDAANAREDARILKAELTAAKSKATKLANRAKGGACPCCNRTFVQLSRHIASKHPEFAKATP